MNHIYEARDINQKEPSMIVTIPKKVIRLGAVGIIVAAAASGTFFTVHERQRSVVTRLGAFNHVAGPGFHFKLPILDSVEDFDLTIRSLSLPKLETFTVDNQHVDVDMVVQYQIPASSVERVFRETRDYEQRLTTMAIDRMKIALGGHNIGDFPERRGKVAAEVFNAVKSEAARMYGLDVVDLQIVNINYSEAFRKAIDASAVAKAQVEQSHQNQRRAEVDAQTARIRAVGNANAAIEQARGDADAALLRARAEAEATKLRGDAEAMSVRAQSQALSEAGHQFVQLEQARRWNGQLPTQMLSNAPVPILSIPNNQK